MSRCRRLDTIFTRINMNGTTRKRDKIRTIKLTNGHNITEVINSKDATLLAGLKKHVRQTRTKTQRAKIPPMPKSQNIFFVILCLHRGLHIAGCFKLMFILLLFVLSNKIDLI